MAETAEQARNWRVVAAGVLAMVVTVSACWSGWSWYSAEHDTSMQYSLLRDQVLQSGVQAVQNLNTLDYRDLGQGLALWKDSTTSELYQQIVQGRVEFEAEVRKARTVSSAKILEGAVTELDEHSGKARLLIALDLTVTPAEGTPVTKQRRLIAQVTRTATGWKLSDLGQAPVRTS